MASIALYTLLSVIWGSTWLVIKVGYGGLGPFNVAALRFFLAGAVLAVILPLVNARWPRGRTEWSLVIWVGVVMFGADYGLIYWGEQFLDSGLTAILFATLPLITVAFAHAYIPGDRITARKLAGTLLAFLGVVALFGESLRLDWSKLGPMAAIVGGAVCAAAAGVASKRHGGSMHSATLNAPAMLVGGVTLAVDGVGNRRNTPAAERLDDLGRDRLPGDRGKRGDVPRLLFAAEDLERDQPELHQRVHTGDRARPWFRVPRRAADGLVGGRRRPDPVGRRAGADRKTGLETLGSAPRVVDRIRSALRFDNSRLSDIIGTIPRYSVVFRGTRFSMYPDDAETVFASRPPVDEPADTTGIPASAGARPKEPRGPLNPGQQFGSRYHILRQLGIGGMGAVYQAYDQELEVAVALKVIRPEVTRDATAAQDIERRFKQELLLARQVTHKNVVRIHDLGEIDGIKYITMPYIKGADLATVLRDERLPVSGSWRSPGEIAAGLQAAHDAGVVHRDLKPANVMIEGDDNHAVIMDFGIARSTSRVGSVPAPSTASGGSIRRSATTSRDTRRPSPARSSAPSNTWRPSRRAASTSISGPTSTRSASWSTTC